jgi:SAM-dependent methyltransferase
MPAITPEGPAMSLRSWLASIRPIRIAYDELFLSLFSHRIPQYLRHYQGINYSASGSGYSHVTEIHRLSRLGAIKQRRVLIVGVEQGNEVKRLWARERPLRLVGIDIGEYQEEWRNVLECLDRSYPGVYRFERMNATQLTFPDESFDLVYSQGVLPHIMDLPAFLAGAQRVLRPGGIFYAFCCPLWRTYGGPHVGCLGYDHLLLPDPEFIARAKAVGNGWEHWLNLGLFNRLRFRELLEQVQRFFVVSHVGVIGSPEAERFRKRNPDVWAELRTRYDEEDLLIRLAVFIGHKESTAERNPGNQRSSNERLGTIGREVAKQITEN